MLSSCRRVPRHRRLFPSPRVGDRASCGRRRGLGTGACQCCSPIPTWRPNPRWQPSVQSSQSIATTSESLLVALRGTRPPAMSMGRLWRRGSGTCTYSVTYARTPRATLQTSRMSGPLTSRWVEMFVMQTYSLQGITLMSGKPILTHTITLMESFNLLHFS